MADTASCQGCHESFLRENMICITRITKNNKVTRKWYCKPCMRKKESYEYFSKEICGIFHFQAPGPRINATRAKLVNLGYTDKEIIEAVKYGLDSGYSKELETIGFVTPDFLEEIRMEKEEKDYQEKMLVKSFTNTKYIELYPPRKRNKIKNNINDNISDLLGDDVI